MDKIKERFGPVDIPESRLFCHPSRIGNIYEPGVEEVIQQRSIIPEDELSLSIKRGQTPDYVQLVKGGPGKKWRTWRESLGRRGGYDFGERLIYDARRSFNGNMAHLIHEHMVILGYVKAKLGYGNKDVIVVMDNQAPSLAIKVFSAIGYETCLTNLPVAGNLLSIQLEETRYLLPSLAALDIVGWIESTPPKVFISRKDTRKLVNETDVMAMLNEHGYERYFFDDLSVMEQWSLLRNASSVVATHGAALGCLAFHSCKQEKGPIELIELLSPGLVANVFRKYMAILGGKWVGCRGRLTPEVIRDIDNPSKYKDRAYDDYTLAPSVIKSAMNYLGQH